MRESHEQQGGEAACWLHQVCEECGRVRENPSRADCEHCGHDPLAERADEMSAAPGRGRDRDPQGKARNARPRDGLGRPLPYGQQGVARQPEGVVRTPGQTLAEAQRLLDQGMPFHAHEVLEDAWKTAPGREQPMWKGLAQIAVGITHIARGNVRGGPRLLLRGADAIEPYRHDPPHGIDIAGLARWARSTADSAGEDEGSTASSVPARPPSLRGPGGS